MKKSVRKKHTSKRKTHSQKILPFVSFRAVFIALGVLALIIGIKNIADLTSTVHVLGVSTGPVPLLADKGSDDGSSGGDSHDSGGSSGGGGSHDSGSGGSSGGSSSGGSSNGGSGGESHGSTSGGDQPGGAPSGILQEMKVDCVGPDGKHFTVSFHDCQEINSKWGNAGFRFTPLPNSEQERKPELEIEKPEKIASGPAHSQLEMQTEGNKGEINMETPGLHVEVKREDDGSVHITAKRADGTEVNLQTSALEKLNEALKDKEVEVATSSSSTNSILLRRRGVEAETELPISVDPATHELTVTTPAGIKTVTILPDQAINNLLTDKVFTSIETQVSSSSGVINQKSTLTELNNEPVFAVNGVTQKRVFGLIPVGFAKTAFVSAANGNVVQVNETVLNRLIEALSF